MRKEKYEVWLEFCSSFAFYNQYALHYDEGLGLSKYSLGFLIGELAEGMDFALK